MTRGLDLDSANESGKRRKVWWKRWVRGERQGVLSLWKIVVTKTKNGRMEEYDEWRAKEQWIGEGSRLLLPREKWKGRGGGWGGKGKKKKMNIKKEENGWRNAPWAPVGVFHWAGSAFRQPAKVAEPDRSCSGTSGKWPVAPEQFRSTGTGPVEFEMASYDAATLLLQLRRASVE